MLLLSMIALTWKPLTIYLCKYYTYNIYLYPQSLKRNQNQHQNLPQYPRQVRCLKYHAIYEIWNTDAGIFLCLFYLLKAMWTMWLQFQVEITVTHSMLNCQKQSFTFNIHFSGNSRPSTSPSVTSLSSTTGLKERAPEEVDRYINVYIYRYINVYINEKKIRFTCMYTSLI